LTLFGVLAIAAVVVLRSVLRGDTDRCPCRCCVCHQGDRPPHPFTVTAEADAPTRVLIVIVASTDHPATRP
jgi:hypothetical protein